jgi:membrane protein implicated in regulation of membrane protease activity
VSSLFLGCFSFGLLFAVASFALGAFGGGHGVHGVHLHAGDTHSANGETSGHHAHISPFNLSTIAAFLTWFGGAGYLLTRYSGLTTLAATALATAIGAVGGGIVFVGLARIILPRLTVMRPEDYELQGIVARVTSTILPGGTGEIVYALGGTRHSDGARSEGAELLERGTEVVILRMDKGIAYVERWTKFADANQLPPADAGAE